LVVQRQPRETHEAGRRTRATPPPPLSTLELRAVEYPRPRPHRPSLAPTNANDKRPGDNKGPLLGPCLKAPVACTETASPTRGLRHALTQENPRTTTHEHRPQATFALSFHLRNTTPNPKPSKFPRRPRQGSCHFPAGGLRVLPGVSTLRSGIDRPLNHQQAIVATTFIV